MKGLLPKTAAAILLAAGIAKAESSSTINLESQPMSSTAALSSTINLESKAEPAKSLTSTISFGSQQPAGATISETASVFSSTSSVGSKPQPISSTKAEESGLKAAPKLSSTANLESSSQAVSSTKIKEPNPKLASASASATAMQMPAYQARYIKLSQEQKADISLRELAANRIGFLYHDKNKDSKLVSLPDIIRVWQGNGVAELSTYLLTPGKIENSRFKKTGNPIHVGIKYDSALKQDKAFVIKNKEWTNEEFSRQPGLVYLVQGKADWTAPRFGQHIYNEEDAQKAGILDLLKTNNINYERFFWRVERIPVLNDVRYNLVVSKTVPPVENESRRVAVTGDEKTIGLTIPQLAGIEKGLAAEIKDAKKKRSSMRLEADLEVLVLAGFGTQMVSRNYRTGNNPVLQNIRETLANQSYEAELSARIGNFIVKAGAEGNHYDGSSVTEQNIDRQSLALGYVFDMNKGSAVPMILADRSCRGNEKDDGMLKAKFKTIGNRTGAGLNLKYGKFDAELAYLVGDLERSGEGSLFGIPINVPAADVDSERIYAAFGLNLPGARISPFYANETITRDAKSSVENYGVSLLLEPIKSKIGNFSPAIRASYDRVNNHGYAGNSNGFTAALGIQYAKALANLPRRQ